MSPGKLIGFYLFALPDWVMRTTRFMVLVRNPFVLSKSPSRSSRRRWWSRASPSISSAIDFRWLVLLAILQCDFEMG